MNQIHLMVINKRIQKKIFLKIYKIIFKQQVIVISRKYLEFNSHFGIFLNNKIHHV